MTGGLFLSFRRGGDIGGLYPQLIYLPDVRCTVEWALQSHLFNCLSCAPADVCVYVGTNGLFCCVPSYTCDVNRALLPSFVC